MRRLRCEVLTAPALADSYTLLTLNKKKKALSEKISPKAQGIQKDKFSRLQGSELPSGRHLLSFAISIIAPSWRSLAILDGQIYLLNKKLINGLLCV